MTTPANHIGTSPERLSIGTQELEMRKIFNARCACGKTLLWIYMPDEDQSPSAECSCGMYYYAWPATVKVEGIDRRTL